MYINILIFYLINIFINFIQKHGIKFQILHNLLKSSINAKNTNFKSIVPMVLKTLHKLTRSLRLRIYYYCEPCIANKKQKVNKYN